jgi:hypothetical protein
MFATLSGALPRPPGGPSATVDDLVRLAVERQDAAGLELPADGRLRGEPGRVFAGGLDGIGTGQDGALGAGATPAWTRPITVDAWRFAASCTSKPLKQALPGPYSLGRRISNEGIGRDRVTLALAAALNAEIRSLGDAGCPFVEIEEPEAALVGDDAERALWREAHARLTDGLARIHLSLAIVGGNADAAGVDTIFEAPYVSHLFDLVAGPDNWRLVTRAPAERGIVCAALGPASRDPGLELLAWAAHYAASAGGRGLDRVGVANAPGLDAVPWNEAVAKLEQLGKAAAVLASPDASELAGSLDPRAISTRSAAAGTWVPRPRRRRKTP